MLAGDQRPFGETQMRDLVRHDVDRARDFAARRNHDLLAEGESLSASLSSIIAPTLVIHGTADPMFPVKHGESLAHEIPVARLLRLDGPATGSTLQIERRSPRRSSTTRPQPIPPDEREKHRLSRAPAGPRPPCAEAS
jgi:hypothetical protein